MDPVAVVVVVVVVALSIVGALALLVSRSFQAPRKGEALIISGARGDQVAFAGRVVLPIVHRVERIDITTRILEIERRGGEGIHCRDNIRVDIRARFFVRVQATAEDVLRVARSLGCARASDPAALRDLFEAKFLEGLKIAAREFEFDALTRERPRFRDHVLEIIGVDLGGFVLEDLVIDALEQTPIAALDPNNILDAEGIRRITERTAAEQITTNELRTALELARQRAAQAP